MIIAYIFIMLDWYTIILFSTVGPPCQAPITYYIGRTQYRLQKSNYHGVCYLPNPIYDRGQTVGPYSQKQEWHAKAANSISLCEEENGSDEGCKQVPNDMGKTL